MQLNQEKSNSNYQNVKRKEVTGFEKPTTRYARSKDIHIAYQVFGNGPTDLIYVPGWISNIDLMWSCPELVQFLMELSKSARIILFDKRGTGLSDKVSGYVTLEERMDDILSVMDDVGIEKATLFGHSEGGSASALFAATYPEKVTALITFGIFAKRRYSADYPWAPTEYEREKTYHLIENNWGGGGMELEKLAPSKANDQGFMNWLAMYFRSGASPGTALMLTKMNTDVDITDILQYIKVPSLIMHRDRDIDVKVEEGKYVANKIEGSQYVQFEGPDHLFWVGDTDPILKEMRLFISNLRSEIVERSGLYTYLAVGSDSPDFNDEFKCEIKKLISERGGDYVKAGASYFVYAFKRTADATKCSFDLYKNVRRNKAQLKSYLYLADGFQRKDDFSIRQDHLLESIFQNISDGQVTSDRIVKRIMQGSSYRFYNRIEVCNDETNITNALYTVSRAHEQYYEIDHSVVGGVHDTFMKKVLSTINRNLDNEEFGIDFLRKELGLSERQLQRKVKAKVNQSPHHLINAIRLQKAKELLLHGNYNVNEVAFKMGFTNPSYFSRLFKKAYGVSPKKISSSV